MSIRPVNTNFLALKLARSPAQALRVLRARNISANIFGCGKLSINDGYDLKKAITRFKKLGICPQLDHRVVARTIREAGSPAVIRALESRGITDFDAAKSSFPERIWSRDLYAAIQNFLRFTKDDSLDKGTKNMYLSTWMSFQEFACSASTTDDRKLVIKILFDMIKMHDKETEIHCSQTRAWAMAIATGMGLPAKDIKTIGLAAYLHDLGKISVTKDILNKKGRLNKEELSRIRDLHVTFGSSLLKDCGWADDILEMIKYHHYIKSYPEGIEPEKAPLGARILAVADSADAATAGRLDKKGKTLKTVLVELRAKKNNYDQNVVDAYEKIIKNPR